MSRAAIAVWLVAGITAAPRVVAACPTCISSGFGDRSYTWAYLGLLLMPFVVAVGIVATLAWYAGWRPQHVADRISAWTSRRKPSPRIHTETP
jgi:uncharacterized membrane protein